jgi:integrase/recombinase XerD
LCQRFESHYREKKFTFNYINKHIYFFGQIIKHAIRNNMATANPLANYIYTKDEIKAIISLSEDELQLMENYKFASIKLQYIADLYVFQCYTGFAFCDAMQFDANLHIKSIDVKIEVDQQIQVVKKTCIVKNRGKTNVEAFVPVFKTTARLLEKYNNVLPKVSNQKYNAYIKEVADVLGIEKNLTTHTARKTFGMIKLNEGFSIESVARMMGHNGTTITQKTYARVTHVRINKEMLALGFYNGTQLELSL